jgi:hypothetical protein
MFVPKRIILTPYVTSIVPAGVKIDIHAGLQTCSYLNLTIVLYNRDVFGDARLRRRRLNPDGEPRGTDLVKSVQNTSAKRTNYAALPLAA